LADKVGGMFTHYENQTSMNFVAMNTTAKYDAMDYFPSTGYTVYPSATGEKLYVGGAIQTLTLQQNPILNYAKAPVVTFIDDHQFARGEDALQDWSYAKAEEYSIPLTFPSYFANTIFADDINSYINLSLERNGALFEIADHNWNHTSFFTYQGYTYQWNTVNASESKWKNYTTIPLI